MNVAVTGQDESWRAWFIAPLALSTSCTTVVVFMTAPGVTLREGVLVVAALAIWTLAFLKVVRLRTLFASLLGLATGVWSLQIQSDPDVGGVSSSLTGMLQTVLAGVQIVISVGILAAIAMAHRSATTETTNR